MNILTIVGICVTVISILVTVIGIQKSGNKRNIKPTEINDENSNYEIPATGKTIKKYSVCNASEYYDNKPEITPEEIEQKFENIAKETMVGLDKDPRWLMDLDVCANIDRECPYTTQVLVSNNEIVGYYYFLFLKKKYFNEIKNGSLTDADINLDKIVTSDFPGEYFCYFNDIAIFPKHRWSGFVSNSTKLLDDFAERLEEYAVKSKIFISEMCAVGFTDNGKNMCTHLGMKKVKNTDNVYSLKLLPFPQKGLISERYPKLKELYDKRYSEISATTA